MPLSTIAARATDGDDSRFTHYPKITLGADALYRTSVKHATGIGLDLTYSANMRQLEEAERIIYGDQRVDEGPGYSPLSIGVGLVQEMFWKNFSGYLSVGFYPYKKRGIREDHGLYYQKAGATTSPTGTIPSSESTSKPTVSWQSSLNCQWENVFSPPMGTDNPGWCVA